jgi:hypothetical protein
VKRINQEELFNILAAIDSPQPIGLSTLTNSGARKTDNPYGEIYKLTKSNCFVGGKYENMINNALVRKGRVPGFEVGERTWGGKLTACIVQKGDKSYLAAQVLKRQDTYLYRKNGILTVIDKEKIKEFLKPKVEELVQYRNFSLDNIVGINLGGIQYKIRITNKISTKNPAKPAKIKSIKKDYIGDLYDKKDKADFAKFKKFSEKLDGIKQKKAQKMEDEIMDDPNSHIDEFLDHGDK